VDVAASHSANAIVTQIVLTAADELLRFNACKDHGLVLIVLSVDPTMLYQSNDPVNPGAVWDKLSSQY